VHWPLQQVWPDGQVPHEPSHPSPPQLPVQFGVHWHWPVASHVAADPSQATQAAPSCPHAAGLVPGRRTLFGRNGAGSQQPSQFSTPQPGRS
jgi:hypothetical protein